MPVRESEAIILRGFPLGEGDRLISFLSRAEGRLRGVASGARKPKSKFGSTLESLSYVRITFYERETRELVRISQCELLESFMTLQSDFSVGVACALLSEITDAVLGEREKAEPNFRLLLSVARGIKAGAKLNLALAYFTFWTARLGGWLPRLDRCARCGNAWEGSAYFSMAHALVCRNCHIPGQKPLPQASLLLAQRMATENIEKLMNDPVTTNAGLELRDFMLDLIEHHIEKHLQSRTLLNQKLETLS